MEENQMKRRMIDKNKYDSGSNQARVHLLSFGQIFLFEQKQKLHAQIRK